MNDSFTFASSGCLSSNTSNSTSYIGISTDPSLRISSGTSITDPSLFTINPSTKLTINTNMNYPVQNKVAVFKVTRNDKNEITSTEFLKEMWVETKNNQSVEFVVARDKDLAKYNAEDLSIRAIYSVTF